jgi:hypothetical protein
LCLVSSTKNVEEENFKNFLRDTKRIYTTPAAPKTLFVRPKEGDPLPKPERQKQFRMGVGMLLYLLKHLRADISNSVRELSKVADVANKEHFKALLRTIKYGLVTEHWVYYFSQS